MTKPVNRPHKKPGKPLKLAPPDARARIEAYAADGFSVLGIANSLGVAKETFAKWLDLDPTLREAMDVGRERERHTLHNMLYRQATEAGNATAAMFLLKARHGYQEGQQEGMANKVSITFNLPGALQPEQFTIENDHDRRTENIALPKSNLVRS